MSYPKMINNVLTFDFMIKDWTSRIPNYQGRLILTCSLISQLQHTSTVWYVRTSYVSPWGQCKWRHYLFEFFNLWAPDNSNFIVGLIHAIVHSGFEFQFWCWILFTSRTTYHGIMSGCSDVQINFKMSFWCHRFDPNTYEEFF